MRVLGTILKPGHPARLIEFDSDWEDDPAGPYVGKLLAPVGARRPAFVIATYDDGEQIIWTLPTHA